MTTFKKAMPLKFDGKQTNTELLHIKYPTYPIRAKSDLLQVLDLDIFRDRLLYALGLISLAYRKSR